jgi:hypothetical protein
MRAASITASFCNVNSTGNINVSSASSVGGVAPDSVRYTMCRMLASDIPNTEGEAVLPPPNGGVIVPLIRPGGRFLHEGSRVRYVLSCPLALCGYGNAPTARKSGCRTRGFL